MKNSIIFTCLFVLAGCSHIVPVEVSTSADISIIGTAQYNNLEDIVIQAHGVWVGKTGKTVTHVYNPDLYYYAQYPDDTYSEIPSFRQELGFLVFDLPDGGIEQGEVHMNQDVYIYVHEKLIQVPIISCEQQMCIIDIPCTSGMSGQGIYQNNQVVGLIEATDGERCLVRKI